MNDFANESLLLCHFPVPKVEYPASLNHVLAQIYYNKSATEDQKQTKAKIKAHSDKTKDMPTNGLMAFCTFYDNLNKINKLDTDPFDYGFKNHVLKILFKLFYDVIVML